MKFFSLICYFLVLLLQISCSDNVSSGSMFGQGSHNSLNGTNNDNSKLDNNDDNSLSQNLTVEDALLNEGASVAVTISRKMNLHLPYELSYSLNSLHSDRVSPSSGNINFEAYESTTTILFSSIEDDTYSGDLSITLEIYDQSNSSIRMKSSIKLIDNEGAPSLSFEKERIVVSENEDHLFYIKLNKQSENEVRVKVKSSPISAVENQDYEAIDQVLIFSPGETEKEVIFSSLDNHDSQLTKKLDLLLSEPVGATLSIDKMRVVIEDNDLAMSTLAAGRSHTCAIKNEKVYCWGHNGFGQLGDGTTSNSSTPIEVSVLLEKTDFISAGWRHTCAIQNGNLKCWGQNGSGQLGDGSNMSRLAPFEVPGMDAGVSYVSANGFTTCAIQYGAAKCWGYNGHGQLGNGTSTNSSTPQNVLGLDSGVTQIETGIWPNQNKSHTCAIKEGALYCWGNNSQGQLGIGEVSNAVTAPTPVSGLGDGVTRISTNGLTTCAVQHEEIKCWGYNNNGQVGDGSTINRSVPVKVTNGSNATDVSVNESFTCGSFTDGSIRCWGNNNEGRLGDGTTTNASTPVAVVDLQESVTELSSGSYHTCARKHDEIFCWGHGEHGKLGLGDGKNQQTPEKVTFN